MYILKLIGILKYIYWVSFMTCGGECLNPVISNSSWRHGPCPARLLSPWDSPGENTGVGSYSLLQGVFLTHGWNLGVLHSRWIFPHQPPGKPFCKACFCRSVAQSCLMLCRPMHCITPGFSVLHYLPEFSQTHVHWLGDAIQPSHPLLPPSLPALYLSQY